jgi:hypothetical protein
MKRQSKYLCRLASLADLSVYLMRDQQVLLIYDLLRTQCNSKLSFNAAAVAGLNPFYPLFLSTC